MVTLNKLFPKHGSRKEKRRLGLGPGSGLGNYCTKGMKGQTSRSGNTRKESKEGGQMPLIRHTPKSGFSNKDFARRYDYVNVGSLEKVFAAGAEVTPEALKKAIDLCNRQNADLALFTGDLVNSRSDELLEFTEIFSELKAKDGVYSVLGNHDYGTYVKWNSEADRIANIDSLIARENRMGWRMLNNSHTIIRRGNDSIAVIGVENSGRPPFPDYARLKEASAGTEGMFQILMSHDPTHWRRQILPESDIELTLSGHTHDMQITFFGLSVSSFIYPEHNGMYMEGERGLYVNIGLGHVLFPMRLGAWPEITVITLKKK